MLKTTCISAFFVLFGWLLPLSAQIALSPSFVFIDEKSGVGNLYVSNRSEQAYEVTISFAFGYPASDSEGNLVMNYDDPEAYSRFALDEMIRAFPKSFVIKKGEQRTVRLQIIPNQRKKEGAFYTRMKVLAKPQSPEVVESTVEGIGTKISFNFEQVTAVFYHKGKVNTGLVVKELDVKQVDTLLQLRPTLERTGNAPYLGSMYARLKDNRGNVLAETQSTTTAYFDVIRRMDLNIAGVSPGTYKLELSFETRRNDMMASDLVQAPKLVHEVEVRIE